MKISGSATLHAPPARVWQALNDPAVLAAAIPGCDHLAVTAPGTCHLTVTAAVASTPGTYTGEIGVSERREPASFRLAATAAGEPGTLSATAQVRLEPAADGTTHVTYDADAVPDGLLAGVGQRLLASTARKMAGDFLAAIDDALLARGPAVPPPSGATEAPSARPPRGVRPPTADRQPAGRLPARPPTESFMKGVLAGAAITLAATGVARLLRRRAR